MGWRVTTVIILAAATRCQGYTGVGERCRLPQDMVSPSRASAIEYESRDKYSTQLPCATNSRGELV